MIRFPQLTPLPSFSDLFASWAHQRRSVLERQELLRRAKG